MSGPSFTLFLNIVRPIPWLRERIGLTLQVMKIRRPFIALFLLLLSLAAMGQGISIGSARLSDG